MDGVQVSPGPSTTTTPSSTAATPIHNGPSLYSAGEEVLALWKQNRKYPATILRIQDDGGYVVRYGVHSINAFKMKLMIFCVDFMTDSRRLFVVNASGESANKI